MVFHALHNALLHLASHMSCLSTANVVITGREDLKSGNFGGTGLGGADLSAAGWLELFG